MVLLAMPTPRRPLGLLPPQSPAAPTLPADSTTPSIAPNLASTPPSPLPLPAVPARNPGNPGGQGQQLLSPVFGLLRAATASPVAAAAAAAAAVHALTSAAASATSPCMFAGGGGIGVGPNASTSHSSSSTSSSRQRLRTFSTTSCAPPSPLVGLADDLVHALLHPGANPSPKHSHMLGARSRTASLDHAGALRSSAMALSAISPHILGGSSLQIAHARGFPESRANSLPMHMPPPTRFSPQPPPFMASPPARVAAPAPPSSSSSFSSSVQQHQPSPWVYTQQHHQRQLPTPTLQISLAPQHQQQHHLALPIQPFPTRSTRSSLAFGRRTSNSKSLAPINTPLYNNYSNSKGGGDDDETLHLPAKPLGLLSRSSTGTYLHSPNYALLSSSSDLLDLGYLADSEHDPATAHNDHSPPFTPHSLRFAHPLPAPAPQHLPPFASRAAAPTLILPPPIPIPSSSVHNPSSSSTYLHFASPRPAAPSLVCPQPTRSTSTFQFAVVPAYDPTCTPSSPANAGAAASATPVSFGAEAFPVIAPSPIPHPAATHVDSIKTPPRTFVMHPPSPISRPGGGGGGGAAAPASSPSSPMLPRLVAPRPVRALPASAAAVGIKNVLAHGLPPRTSPVSPMVARAGGVGVADVGKFGG